jgi:2-hydroxychromene-2-carboxylate isomerase
MYGQGAALSSLHTGKAPVSALRLLKAGFRASSKPPVFAQGCVVAFVGEVISIEQARARRGDRGGSRAAYAPAYFYFDLACPFSYLAAERIERLFARVLWRPVLGAAVHQGDPWADPIRAAAARAAAERRAEALRVPLLWPDEEPGAGSSPAMRMASFAAERGRVAAFALAAGRLAWCGGFALDDPEVLAEAAAAAGLGLDDALDAAGDAGRDGAMEATARRLLAGGADRLPAVVANRRLFVGELRLGEAAAVQRAEPRRAAVGR